MNDPDDGAVATGSVIPTDTGTAAAGFPSLEAIRAAHLDWLKRYRDSGDRPSPQLLDGVRRFIRRGVKTGAVLRALEDRRAAQTLLDFWVTNLYRAGEEPPDSALAEFDPSLSPDLDPSLCPYLGLEAFDKETRDRFFGRESLIRPLIERLKSQRLLAIVGPSGSGKSSLLRAGLLPRLEAGAIAGSQSWHYYPPMVPEADPLVSLARTVLPAPARDDDETVAQLARDFLHERGTLARKARELGKAHVVLAIDQFEELFTLSRDQDRRAFIDNLLDLFHAEEDHTVILTMREEYDSKVKMEKEFYTEFQNASTRITALSAAELRETIEKPAALVGLGFESGLVDRLIKDVLDEPAALPLLQFCLRRLWELKDRNLVTWEAYKSLVNARVALDRTADAIYSSMPIENQQAAQQILLELVKPEGVGSEFVRRRVKKSDLLRLGASDRCERVLDRLIEARLLRFIPLQGPAADNRDGYVEVMHEALVRNWLMFTEWLEKERDHKKQRLRLNAAVEVWKNSGEDPGALLGGAPLRHFELSQYEDLSESEARFIKASQDAENEFRRKQEAARELELKQVKDYAASQAALAVAQGHATRRLYLLLVALLVICFLALGMYYQTLAERRSLQEKATGLDIANFNRLIVQEDWFGGILWLLDARQYHRRDLVRDAVTKKREVLSSKLSPRLANVWFDKPWAAMSPDAGKAATVSDGSMVRVWNLNTGARLDEIAHPAPLRSLGFSPDGRRLITLTASEAFVWDLAHRSSPSQPESRLTATVSVFDPTGSEIAFINDNLVSIVKLDGGASRVRMFVLGAENDLTGGGSDAKTSGAASRSGFDRSRGPSASPPASEHGTTEPRTQNERGSPRSRIAHAALGPDSRWLATATENQSVRVWDATTGKPVSPPIEHPSAVNSVEFSPDGRWVATASDDFTARVWDARTGSLISICRGHDSNVSRASFSPDSRWLVTAGDDLTARVWEARTGLPVTIPLKHTGHVVAVMFSPDARRVLTLDQHGVAREWDMDSSRWMATIRDGLDDQGNTNSLIGVARAQSVLELRESAEFRLTAIRFKDNWNRVLESRDAEDSDSAGQIDLSTERVVAWHKRAAIECDATGRWSSEAWHYKRLIREGAISPSLVSNKVDALARSGAQSSDKERLTEARGSFEHALELTGALAPDDRTTRIRLSLLRQIGKACAYLDSIDDARYNFEESRRIAESRVNSQSDGDFYKSSLMIAYDQLADLSTKRGDRAAAEDFRARSFKVSEEWAKTEPRNSKARFNLAYSYKVRGLAKFDTNKNGEAWQDFAEALKLLRKVVDEEPENNRYRVQLAIVYKEIGDLSVKIDRVEEARKFLGDLALFDAWAKSRPVQPKDKLDLARASGFLAEFAKSVRDLHRSHDYWSRALQLYLDLLKADREDLSAKEGAAEAYEWLADVDLSLRNVTGAIDAVRHSVKLKEELTGRDPRPAMKQALSFAYLWQGNVDRILGEFDEARATFNKALKLRKELSAAKPRDGGAQDELADAYWDLGDLEFMTGETAAALDHFLQCGAIREKLHDLNRENYNFRRKLAQTYAIIGGASMELGDFSRTRHHLEKGRAKCEEWTKDDPASVEAQDELANAWAKLAEMHFRFGEIEKARIYGEKHVNSRRSTATGSSSNPPAQEALAAALEWLVGIEVAMGDAAKSQASCLETVRIREKLLEADREDVPRKRSLAASYKLLGDVHLELGETAKALEWYAKALSHDKPAATARSQELEAQVDLADVLGRTGNAHLRAFAFPDALANFQRGVGIFLELEGAGKLKGHVEREAFQEERSGLVSSRYYATHPLGDPLPAESRPEEKVELLTTRAMLYALRGDHVNALVTADRLRQLDPRTPDLDYDVARCYARCYRVATKGKVTRQPQDPKLAIATQYAELAVKALGRATEPSTDKALIARLLRDPVLAILRQESGYRRIIERLESRDAPHRP